MSVLELSWLLIDDREGGDRMSDELCDELLAELNEAIARSERG